MAVKQTTINDSDLEELLIPYLPKEPVRRGDIVKGRVSEILEDCMLVDIGQKCEGMVQNSEMSNIPATDLPQEGDEVEVYVLKSHDRNGVPILSFDRALGEEGWRVLEQAQTNNTTLEGKIVDINRGGVIVLAEGVQGFIPISQLSNEFRLAHNAETKADGPSNLTGTMIKVKVLDLDRRRYSAILSEKAAAQEVKLENKKRLVNELQEGWTVKGKVVAISDFGIFVDVGGADGLVHRSEISWERSVEPSDVVHIGQEVEVYVDKIDREELKIGLSLKKLHPKPWEQAVNSFVEGKKIKVQITHIAEFGAFARVSPGIEGLIHKSELSSKQFDHPSEIVKEGQELEVEIVRVEADRERLGLSLKRLETQATLDDVDASEVAEAEKDQAPATPDTDDATDADTQQEPSDGNDSPPSATASTDSGGDDE